MRGHLYHSGSKARTSAGSARSPALGPAAVLALQRRVGNRAVRQTLQRAPTLKDTGPTGTFTSEALKYFNEPANKSKGIGEYAMHLANKANEPLKALGVPEMKPVFDSGSPYPGAFYPDSWKLLINTTLWGKGAQKLRDLSVDQAADGAALIYHEARHAEQRFRVARVLAADSKARTTDKIADEIQKALSIKERPVALAAAGSPLAKGSANDALRAEAHDWREITTGQHAPYRQVVNDWELELIRALNTVSDVMKRPMNIGDAKDKIGPIVKGWKSSATRAKFLPKHTRRVAGIRKQTAGDKDVEKNLKEIQKAMKKVSDEWDAIETAWRTDSLNQKLKKIIDFKPHLYSLYAAVHTAYTEQAHEKDAFETGNLVAAQFKAAAASASSSSTQVPAGSTR